MRQRGYTDVVRILCLLAACVLAGCAADPAQYANHPSRKTVTVDGAYVSVVPKGKDTYIAVIPVDKDTDAAVLKAREIRAIEMAGGCKVSSADFISAPLVLKAVCK